MSGTVDIIKERLTIVDVVGSYVQLQKAGKYFKAKSPFTNERTPSFYVSPDKGLYHCFSTGKGGDIFTFVQEMEGVDFKGALKVLAERAGVELAYEDPKQRSERDQLFSILEAATAFYREAIMKRADAREYLEGRGLRSASAEAWRIGFAPEGWHDLSEHLKRTVRATDEQMERVGLVIKGERGYYDRFRSRIMFPISDASGRVVGFSGRAFGIDADKGPKYMNSPETELFDKSSVLYGFNRAKHGIHKMGYAIVVEGQMDMVMSHQVGCTNAVASSGTALTDRQLELIKRIAPKILVAYDADKAGMAASERAWQLALGLGIDVKIARLPKGKDPAELAAEGIEALKAALRDSTHIVDFVLAGVLADGIDDKRVLARRIEAEVVPYIARIPGEIEANHFVKKVSEATGFAEDAVREQTRAARRAGASQGTRSDGGRMAPAATDAANDAMRRLFSILWWQSDGDSSVDVVASESKLAEAIGEDAAAAAKVLLEPERDALAFKAQELYAVAKPAVIVREVDDLLARIETDHLQRKRSEVAEALKGPPGEGAQAALAEYQALSKRIDELQARMSK